MVVHICCMDYLRCTTAPTAATASAATPRSGLARSMSSTHSLRVDRTSAGGSSSWTLNFDEISRAPATSYFTVSCAGGQLLQRVGVLCGG